MVYIQDHLETLPRFWLYRVQLGELLGFYQGHNYHSGIENFDCEGIDQVFLQVTSS